MDRFNIDAPLWDQGTFSGRFKHFAFITDPRTVITSDEELDKAKALIKDYRAQKELPGVTKEQLIYAKKLYESAFHPDSEERQNIFGRMSFQVPGGMIITGAMLQFYKTIPGVVFWQWVNQSFNALVNYTNRNANSPVTGTQITAAYVSATASALVTALGCKSYWQKRASPLLQRYVPFLSVAAANLVNIPLMRQNEIIEGIDLQDDNGNIVGKSRVAAAKGIGQVVLSRIAMCAPGMIILPVIMERLEKIQWFKKLTPIHGPVQVMMVGCFLIFMVPTACAIFPQQCSINISTIERFENERYKQMLDRNKGNLPSIVYFNKGL